MYFAFVEKVRLSTIEEWVLTECHGKGEFSMNLLPVMGLFSYATDFWVKRKTGCRIFSADINRSTEIEHNLCLLKSFK